jgi:hypothetical protein
MTTKHQVIAAHRAHPEWTASDIAAHLGCLREYVSATAKRNGLKLATRRPGRLPYIELTASTVAKLERFADDREICVADLAKLIIETVARDDMVDAVLDDRVAA